MGDQSTAPNAVFGWLSARSDEMLAQWMQADVALQSAALLAATLAGWVLGRIFRQSIGQWLVRYEIQGLNRRLIQALLALVVPVTCLTFLLLLVAILTAVPRQAALLLLAASLLAIWIAVRFVAAWPYSPFWSRTILYLGWPLITLVMLGWLDPLIALLDGVGVPLAGSDDDGLPRLTVLDLLRNIAFLALLFWVAGVAGQFLRERIEASTLMNPIARALAVKMVGISMPALAVLIALQVAGFDLAALAVFSGAAGLGIGLGLQRIVANYVAGFTLVADRSIKPGDVIEIDGTFGWVTAMHGRYVALRTRDGTERLVPNERFMSEGVVNWTRSDKVVRVHTPFGVSYATPDLRVVQALAVDVARMTPRVVAQPQPVCLLREFGESSVDFDLRFWIEDPEAGLANIRSEVLCRLWDRLREAGIEIPFPQRDLHVRSWPAVPNG